MFPVDGRDPPSDPPTEPGNVLGAPKPNEGRFDPRLPVEGFCRLPGIGRLFRPLSPPLIPPPFPSPPKFPWPAGRDCCMFPKEGRDCGICGIGRADGMPPPPIFIGRALPMPPPMFIGRALPMPPPMDCLAPPMPPPAGREPPMPPPPPPPRPPRPCAKAESTGASNPSIPIAKTACASGLKLTWKNVIFIKTARSQVR